MLRKQLAMIEASGEDGIEILSKQLLENGIEMKNIKRWLQEMAEIGYGQAPAVVFRSKSGQLDCIPMPSSIDDTISEIGDRL